MSDVPFTDDLPPDVKRMLENSEVEAQNKANQWAMAVLSFLPFLEP